MNKCALECPLIELCNQATEEAIAIEQGLTASSTDADANIYVSRQEAIDALDRHASLFVTKLDSHERTYVNSKVKRFMLLNWCTGEGPKQVRPRFWQRAGQTTFRCQSELAKFERLK